MIVNVWVFEDLRDKPIDIWDAALDIHQAGLNGHRLISMDHSDFGSLMITIDGDYEPTEDEVTTWLEL